MVLGDLIDTCPFLCRLSGTEKDEVAFTIPLLSFRAFPTFEFGALGRGASVPSLGGTS